MEAFYGIKKILKSSKNEENKVEKSIKENAPNKDEKKEDFVYIDYKQIEKDKETYKEHKFFK